MTCDIKNPCVDREWCEDGRPCKREVKPQPQSRSLPRWTTSWPEWFGIFGNVSVVPAEDYDRLLASIKSNLPSGMVELVLESSGLTPSGAAAQAGEKSGTAPTASAPAVLSRHSTWKRDAIEWSQETIENGPAASIGPDTGEALAQTIMAYAASSERLPAGCRIAEAYRVIPEGNWYVVQIDGPTAERRLENFLRDEGYKFLVRRSERQGG